MRVLTDEEEEIFDRMAEYDPDAAATMRECWAVMSDEGREKFVRFAERLARLPAGLDPTKEQLDRMVESDSDFPLH